MKPLSESQTGTLDDDFNNMRTWIYSDYGRVVVTPARPPRPAIPYLQNGFALLQIAVQEAREYHATMLPFLALSYIVFTGCQVYFVCFKGAAMHQVAFCSIEYISVPNPRNSLGNVVAQRADSYHISLRMANLLHVRSLGYFHRESRPHPSSDPLCF